MQTQVDETEATPAIQLARAGSAMSATRPAPAPAAEPRSAVLPRAISASLKDTAFAAFRRFLAKRGYVIARSTRALAPDLKSYASDLAGRGTAIEHVLICDTDPEPVRVLLTVFRSENVTLCSRPQFTESDRVLSLRRRLLIEIDASRLGDMATQTRTALFASADILLLRLKPLHALRGSIEIAQTCAALAEAGLALADVLQRPVESVITSATANIFLAFERNSFSPGATVAAGASFRVAETLTYLTAPIIGDEPIAVPAGRGSFGIAAGVSNPGAVVHENRTVLLARGERLPWAVQKQRWSAFVGSVQPMLIELDDELAVENAAEVNFDRAPASSRAEDFRLFTHNGKIYSNHSVLRCETAMTPSSPVVPESLPTEVGISAFDVAARRLSYLGTPRLGRAAARVEKNWAMFSSGDKVHLIYSNAPYRVYSTDRFPNLDFTVAIDEAIALPLPNDGLPVRNSINPIPYDGSHFLHVVHKVYPTKHYAFWAMLIDRTTLRPAYITDRPVLRSTASGSSSILYACAATTTDTDVNLFGGIDDSAVGCWRVSRSTLQRHWRPVASRAA